MVASPVEHYISSLHNSEGRGLPNLILNCLRLKLFSKPGQVNQLLSLSLIAAQAMKLGMEVSKLAGAALQDLPCSRAGSSPWAGVRQQVFPSTSGSGNEWQWLRVAEVTSDRGYKWQGLRVAKKEIRTTFCQT